MMAVDNNSNSRQQPRQTTMVAENDGTQDWVVDYAGEGQERAARDGRGSGVAFMAGVAEDGGGG